MLKKEKIQELKELYLQELNENVLPFWQKHSIDKDHGGYFTCLTRNGDVFDTDKFIWLQARQVYTFSKMYNDLAKNPEYLEIAIHGADFLETYGRDPEGNWYFSVNQQGQPLVQAYNIFSDCFACMAFGQLFKATNEQKYKDIALSTFENILIRQSNPKGKYNKQIGTNRALKNFGLPMILANLSLEIEELLDEHLLQKLRSQCIHTVMNEFYRADLGVILENINLDNTFSDTFEGRLINPGHGLEAMWFIMDLASKNKDQELINKCGKIGLEILDYSWDKEFGGIFYFMDVKGYPPQQLEWNQKLWWVHLESAIMCIKAYHLTGDEEYWKWFLKIHNYQWSHFRDPENGEWFGYLNRDGSLLLDLKGGKWKGCFHVPRAMFQISDVLDHIKL